MIGRLIFSGLAVAVLTLGAAASWAVDLIVVDARGVRLTPGQSVDGSKPMTLLDGQQVTLLSANGLIVKLEGPTDAVPDNQVRGGCADVATAVAALITERNARTSEVGVVRGETEVKLPEPWVVDVTHPGTSCVRTGQPVVLWRSENMVATEVTIAPADRSWTVTGKWAAAKDRLSLPASLPLRDETSYVINIGGKMAPVTVRVIPAVVSTDAMRASWMAQVGCQSQATALLKAPKR
jgi:hypothetical protein